MTAPRLTVIAPTFNEVENVERFVTAVTRALHGVSHEILIVDDDSPDLTWKRAEELNKANPRVRVLRRLQNRGLGNSVIDGFCNAQGEAVACIDCDLQHDPNLLPRMLEELARDADLVVGCRYMPGGGTADWGWLRRLESRMATKLAQWVLKIDLRDPMSGYFMLRRVDAVRIRKSLNGDGFKILLEVAAHLRPTRVRELPYVFRARTAGESKLSGKVISAYLKQLLRLSHGRLPWRFLKFALVGASGIVVNLVSLGLVVHRFGITDWRASALASAVATLSNYMLNNAWTFRDRARSGLSVMSGYVSYFLASLLGLGTTTAGYAAMTRGWERIAGGTVGPGVALCCQFAAILIGCYFNYQLNKLITWRKVERMTAAEPGS